MIDWQGNYGSRHGLLQLMVAWVRMSGGGYHALQEIDFSRVRRLVFVCKGNICRSAYAEAWARQLDISATSCGIEAIAGAAANERVRRIGEVRGVSLATHASRPLSTQVFSGHDLLVGMEAWHVEALAGKSGSAQLTLLGLWSRPRRPYLHDPYSASDRYMEKCLDLIESGVGELASRIASGR